MPIHLLPSVCHRPPPGRERGASLPTRRQFLAGAAALGGAALIANFEAAPAPPVGPPEKAAEPEGWYALVSDVHIAADTAHRVLRQNMADHFKAVVADILASDEPPRGVVISGDLAAWDGKPGDYGTLLTLLGPLREARVPIHMALGNHDNREHFHEAVCSATLLDQKHVSAVEERGLRFVLLDSLEQITATPGRLGPAQLDWLAKDLDAHARTPTIVVMHHHVQSVPWSKVAGLGDSTALLEVLQPRRQVKAVVFGHTHVFHARNEGGLYLLNLPAVAYAFDYRQPLGYCRFRPGSEAAGYELRCVGGNRAADRRQFRLQWRDA
jgi:3',5'-cyclic AMP phosphodiesterase CpdA